MPQFHDIFRPMGLLATSSVGSSATYSTAACNTQTRYLRVAAIGAAGSSVYFSLVDAGVTSATGAQLPMNWVEFIKCNPGERLYLRSDSTTCIVNVVEMTD
jgi:hypothetical protein